MRKRWAYLAGSIFGLVHFYSDLNSCNNECFSWQRILGCYPIFARNDDFFISFLQETLRLRGPRSVDFQFWHVNSTKEVIHATN